MQFTNLATSALVEQAILRQEGRLADNGSLLVDTGARTGRSPKDRFIVDDHTTHDVVDWGAVNQPVDPKVFDALWQKAGHYLAERDTFVSHFHVGDDPAHYRPLQLTSEFAWHTLFARNLFIRPDTFNPNNAPVWQMRNAARMVCDPKGDGVNSDAAVMLNFSERKVLICGTQYGGEMKKAMFTVLNFLLPEQRILPMHCGANIGQNGDTSLFFGLSGTGKTTLSADPDRYLIGDDEHGWADDRVFNLEGGCYAKCINLSQANEPVIWEAIRFGALVENVIMDEQTRTFDYNDASKTQNTRVAYPLEHIAMRSEHNRGDVPKAVIFLSCDLTGTLPPVAILSKEAAAYHFLSGYTALVGSTEVGSTAAIKPTFSACFGAPFFPRSPTVYAKLLMDKIDATGARVYLVNTGWTGGAYGTGKRFPIPVTRRVIAAIQNGELDNVSVRHLQPHNLAIPTHIAGIDDALLDPRSAYGNDAAYDKAAAELARAFANNIAKFADLPDSIKRAGPVIG